MRNHCHGTNFSLLAKYFRILWNLTKSLNVISNLINVIKFLSDVWGNIFWNLLKFILNTLKSMLNLDSSRILSNGFNFKSLGIKYVNLLSQYFYDCND